MSSEHSDFEQMYLGRAAHLLGENAPWKECRRLCQAVKQKMDGVDIEDRRTVHLLFQEVYYQKFAITDNETIRVARLFWSKEDWEAEGDCLESFDELLPRLKPVLLKLPLVLRLVAAPRVLGIKYRRIAELLDACVSVIEADIEDRIDLSTAGLYCEEFQTKLLGLLDSADNPKQVWAALAMDNGNMKWLQQILEPQDDVFTAGETLSTLRTLATDAAAARYGRMSKSGLDEHAMIRDLWQKAKSIVLPDLPPRAFLQESTKANESKAR